MQLITYLPVYATPEAFIDFWAARYAGYDENFYNANIGKELTEIMGLLVDGQHVFHLLDVRLVQLGYAPHFFPATASTRGSATKSGLSLGPLWAPTCA